MRMLALLVSSLFLAAALAGCVAGPAEAPSPPPQVRPQDAPAPAPQQEAAPEAEQAPEEQEAPGHDGVEEAEEGPRRGPQPAPAPDDPPVARIEASEKHLLLGDPIRLDGRGSKDPHGQGLRHHWDLGDGATSEGAVMEHTYDREGTFQVQLTVTDAEGLAARTILPVTVESTVYEHGVWFNWPKTDLDILVLGVKDPVVGAAIAAAIKAWELGIADLSPELGARLELRVHWADDIAPPGLDPDILFVPQGFFAVSTRPCIATAPLSHEVLFGPNAQYRVAAHEFGHCLGLTHVFEDGSEYDPAFDLMGGGREERSCPSNLNVQALEMVFSGQSGMIRMPPAAYRQGQC